MEKKHRIQFTLTETLYKRLQQIASEQGISMSAVANIAITEYCRKQQRRTTQEPPEKA